MASNFIVEEGMDYLMTPQGNIVVPPWNMKVMVASSIIALSCQVLQGIIPMVRLLMVLLSRKLKLMEMTGTILMIPEVGGHPRNCSPPDSRPEEYVCMFICVLLEELVVDTMVGENFLLNLPVLTITLKEMKAFLHLAVNMSLTR